jgi:hypothetical protein
MALGTTNTNLTQIAVKRLSGKAMTNSNLSIPEEGFGSTVQTAALTVFGEVLPNNPVTGSENLFLIQSQSNSHPGTVMLVDFDITPINDSQYQNVLDIGDGTNVLNYTGDQGETSINTFHAYVLSLTGSFHERITDLGATYFASNASTPVTLGNAPFTGSFTTTGSVQLQIVPEFVSTINGSTNPYIPQISKKASPEIFEGASALSANNGTAAIDYYLDPFSGLLFVQDPVSFSDGAGNVPGKVRAFIYVGKYQTDVVSGETVDLHISASEGTGFSIANKATASFESGSLGVTITAGGTNKITIGDSGDQLKLVSDNTSTGSIFFEGGDNDNIFSTFNDSAGGTPQQFVLKHNLGDTEFINRRGDLILSASTNNIAIQTNVPATTGLTVKGNISASGAINTDSHITASGNISASGDLFVRNINASLLNARKIEVSELIVSSSVSYITSSFSSGSNIFGDTMDDKHRFTGSLFVTGNINISSGSLIVAAQHSDTSFTNEGIIFQNNVITDNDNRIRLTTAENMQFNAAASFQFKPNNGQVVILDNRQLQFNTENNASKARIVATSGSVTDQVRLDIENDANVPKVSIITSGSAGLEGNVGIGTTSPGSLLSLAKGDATVYDSTDDNGQRNVGPTILLENTSSVSNTFGQILFDSDDSDQGIARIAFLDTGVASTDIAFVTEHTNTKSEKLRITSDGKVGIGTSSPTARLHVSSSGLGLRVENSTQPLAGGVKLAEFLHKDGTNNPQFQISSSANGILLQSSFTTGINGEFRLRANGGSSYMAFDTGLAPGQGGEFMRLTSAGKLGIGTTAPEQLLTVKGGDILVTGSNSTTIELSSTNTGASAQAELKLTSFRTGSAGAGSMGSSRLFKTGSSTRFTLDEDLTIRNNNKTSFVINGAGDINFVSASQGGDSGALTSYLFGDNENKRIGIGGITTPAHELDITGSARIRGPFSQLRLLNDSNSDNIEIGVSDGGDAFMKRGDNNGLIRFRDVDNVDVMTIAFSPTTHNKKVIISGSISASISASIGKGDRLNIYSDATNSTIDTLNNRLRFRTYRTQDYIEFKPNNSIELIISDSGSKFSSNITASSDISSSGKLFFSSSLNSSTSLKTLVYDTDTGQIFHTGSYGGGGGGTVTLAGVSASIHAATGSLSASIVGTANEVEVTSTGPGNITIGLPDNVTIAGNLNVNGSTLATDDTTFNLLDTTATTINFGGAATTIDIGAAGNSNVNIKGSASIDGDLTVKGEVTAINTTELNVEDPFILLNSGSTTGDGGIIVQTAANGIGTALFFDDSANRWAFAESGSTAFNATTPTAHQYVVSVSSSNAAPTGFPSNFGNSSTTQLGMMYVDTSDSDGDGNMIYIYA